MSDLSKIDAELLGIDTPDKFLAVRQKLDFAKGLIRTLEKDACGGWATVHFR